MASNIQSDTSLWLHNKLGTSNDSWTGGSIVSQLTPDILKKIRSCFQDLQPQVKLKLLLSFFHIGRRNLELWKPQLEAILEVALGDSEPWVSMLADLMGTFPATGQLNTEVNLPDSNRKIFQDLLAELKKTMKKHGDMNDTVLPLECHYLNKNAFISVVGHQPQPMKHFSLKRKPKAAALKAELMQRSLEAATKVKSQTNSFPTRIRTMPKKMSDTTPLKGLPSRPLASTGFRSPRVSLPNRPGGGKKEGGVKLLDITEQPMGYQAAKKRKRQQELEDQKKLAEEAQVSANIKQEISANNTTPDYAANLSSTLPPTAAPPPAYVPPTPAAPAPAPVYAPAPPTVTLPMATPPAALPGATVTVPLPTTPLPQTQTRLVQLPTQPLPQARMAGLPQTQATLVTPGLTAPRPVALQTQQHLMQLQPQPPQPGTPVGQQVRPPPFLGQQQQQQQQPQILRQPAIQTIATPVAAQQGQRRNLSLTKDQMLEAQEMFRTANKVTRPEKALILGFMAGSRDNPCPHLGNIVTIKLSENQENVPQTDNTYLTMIVETHFQMNYNTGEWKRIKKYRRLEDVLQ
jgi:negative elongation factor A